jgi:hypothetical protein
MYFFALVDYQKSSAIFTLEAPGTLRMRAKSNIVQVNLETS